MAKTKARGESISGYFRQLFESKPELLDHGKNDVILAHWQADHPNGVIDDRIKGNLANTKSLMRKKFGKIKRRRKQRKAIAGNGAAVKVVKTRTAHAVLERLEGLLDESLSLARHQGTEGLNTAIKHLLAARRAVAWEMGQPS
jgi:hypothetical protein